MQYGRHPNSSALFRELTASTWLHRLRMVVQSVAKHSNRLRLEETKLLCHHEILTYDPLMADGRPKLAASEVNGSECRQGGVAYHLSA